ncbi:MAG: 2,3-bisphosphoglycerate-independent phosphoglycerate mutase [Candidatus Firestonebacteria bacterium]|nr:2,3-bisphosphoglycerate-independent phosphoglycerate mutase [Candidatus Firestonebacteria bacterium]
MSKAKPVMLVIMDGWGMNPCQSHNAIFAAKTPEFDRYMAEGPATFLSASGEAVGLPAGQMGNSEVGHLNLGAGRIVYQEYTRVSKAVTDGSFFQNPEFLAAMRSVREQGKALHLLGLLSDGGVHSHNTHLYALLKLAKEEGLTRVYVHTLLDGRDTPPASGAGYMRELVAKQQELGVGQVATVSGRYYTMDRDKRWERVEMGYQAMVNGKGVQATDPVQAVEASYLAGKTDEFMLPTVLIGSDNKPVAQVQDGDALIFFNFRADRARQIAHAFTDSEFTAFERTRFSNLHFVTLTLYEESIRAAVAFKPTSMNHLLGQVVSQAGLRQLRIAETEKYAHVTYFFNGGEEQPFAQEERALIPSPKVATYDLKPARSAEEVTEEVLRRIASEQYDLIVLNYANGDMVGHTGMFLAALEAVETVDRCVGKLEKAVTAKGGVLLITADHGNAEKMKDYATGKPHTAHTTNQVPLMVRGLGAKVNLRGDGILADVAPTILELLGLPKPEEMTGTSLFENGQAATGYDGKAAKA